MSARKKTLERIEWLKAQIRNEKNGPWQKREFNSELIKLARKIAAHQSRERGHLVGNPWWRKHTGNHQDATPEAAQ